MGKFTLRQKHLLNLIILWFLLSFRLIVSVCNLSNCFFSNVCIIERRHKG